MILASRLRFASRIAGIHFGLSLLAAALVAALVFLVWYPAPYREMMGSFKLFWLIVGVDVVCGPLLTFILASPQKKRREMLLDLTLVAIIQLSAFIYGLHSVYEARPVAVVYEIDRLRVLAQADIYEPELAQAPESYHHIPFIGIWQLATREKKESDDTINDINLALQGYDIGQRPSWWIPYADARKTIQKRALPLNTLMQHISEDKRILIEKTATKHGYPSEKLWFLPITSPKSSEWTAILNNDMHIIDVIPVDGFITL